MPDLERKKLLIIVPTLTAGGSERFISILFNHLDRAVFDVRLLVLNSNTIFYLLRNKEDIMYLNKKDVRSSFLVLLKIIRSERPDITISTITSLNILLCFIRLMYPRFRLIIRESTVLSIHFKGIRNSFLYEVPIKMFYRFADHIVCQSRDMMEDLQSHYGVSKRKTSVINNPIFVDLFPQGVDRKNQVLQLVTIARLDPAKGYDRIVRALSRLKIDFQYTIVGDFAESRLRTEFDNVVSSSGIADKIKLVGVTHDPNEYLKTADVYVHGSYYEGFPNALLEAGAAGVPIVAFNTTGISEIMQNGVNGFVVENNDLEAFAAAIERVGSYPFDRTKIRDIIRTRFDVEIIIKKYQDLLLSIETANRG